MAALKPDPRGGGEICIDATHSFFQRMASTMVLALGILHGGTIARDNDVYRIMLQVLCALVMAWAVQHYARGAACCCPAYAVSWWRGMYKVAALTQDYFSTVAMYVAHKNFLDDSVRGSCTMAEIVRLFILIAALVFIGELVPGAIPGTLYYHHRRCRGDRRHV